MADVQSLFQTFSLKGLSLPNRVVMAPMTRSFSPGGVATEDVAAYYRRRAEGGVGLIVTEGTGIDRPAALNDAKVPRFHGDTELGAWKRVVDEVHAAGGKIAPQLWHVGNQPGPDVLGRLDSPSGVLGTGEAAGEPMSEADIADSIEAFARAAADAKRLGFDAVELHGAHGYLIDQFFWGATNRRADRWGGASLPERCRFAVEVLKAVRAAVGPGFPVILRVSQWKIPFFDYKLAADPAALEAWLTPLADAGADIFHCSSRRFWEPEFEGSDLNLAGWAKKVTGRPTISVGSVGLSNEMASLFTGAVSEPASLANLYDRLDRGEFDLIAVGRAILQDAHWLEKVRTGRMDEMKSFDRSALATLS